MTDEQKFNYLENEIKKLKRDLFNTNKKMEAMRRKFNTEITMLKGAIKRAR